MKTLTFALTLAAVALIPSQLPAADAQIPWRIIIANDTCPDVTWGFNEAQVRRAFANSSPPISTR